MPDYDPERVITAAIERYAKGDPAALAQMILNDLWEAGYDVRPRPDAQNDALSHYSPADEEQAVNEERARRPEELFR